MKEKVESNKILRTATDEEIRALPHKLIEENKALLFAREKNEIMGLNMEIRDAEFQFDCHKLTFFYESNRRIDFRDLVSTLFAQFKTRIWMQRIDKKELNFEINSESDDNIASIYDVVKSSINTFASTERERLIQEKKKQLQPKPQKKAAAAVLKSPKIFCSSIFFIESTMPIFRLVYPIVNEYGSNRS